jgi:hypothetical protein
MLKIAHVEDARGLMLPQEVVDVIVEATTVLDEEYGVNRDIDRGDGGFVVIIEAEADFDKLKNFYLDVNTAIPEYVNSITCADGQVFASVLVLLSGDFAVVVILPMEFLQYTAWKVSVE